MRKHFGLFVLFILTLAGCGPKEKEVKIALALPLTGDIAVLGQGIRRAAILAVEEAVNANRFPDFKVRVVEFDDRSDPKEAVNVANRITSDAAIMGVVGHFNSGCSIPASAIYARAHLPMVSPASSNPELTYQQLSENWRWPRCIFRVNTTDDVQGAFGAEFAAQTLKLKNAAIVHDKTSYGQGVAEEFRKRFVALGGKALSFDGIQVGEKDFKALLTRIKATGPQMIYFGGIFNEGGLIVRQAREIGMKAPFLGSEANYDQEFLRIAGPAAEGAYVTYLGSPPDLLPSAQQFIEKYKARYPNQDVRAYDHYGYEITTIFLDALAQVGPDRDKIIEYLHQVKHEGVLGTTSFDEKGDTLNKTITLFVVKDGQFVPYR
jgi:branched-chain amino acid transport system substrate-binding protein